jgi:hypothetical protein
MALVATKIPRVTVRSSGRGTGFEHGRAQRANLLRPEYYPFEKDFADFLLFSIRKQGLIFEK